MSDGFKNGNDPEYGNGGGGKGTFTRSTSLPPPSAKLNKFKSAVKTVIDNSERPSKNKLTVRDVVLQAQEVANKAAGNRKDNLSVLKDDVVADSLNKGGGFGACILAFYHGYPNIPSVFSCTQQLLRMLFSHEPFLMVLWLLFSLAYAAGVVCLPRFAHICLQIVYKSPDTGAISLERFTTWSLFYILVILGSGVMQQWMFLMSRTSISNNMIDMMVGMKLTAPRSLSSDSLKELVTSDMTSFKSYWYAVHCSIRNFSWAFCSWILIVVEVPEIGGLVAGISVITMSCDVLYDFFCSKVSNTKDKSEIGALIEELDMTAEDSRIEKASHLLHDIHERAAVDKTDQHIHVASKGIQTMMILFAPLLVLYLGNHLVKDENLNSIDIGYCLLYLLMASISWLNFSQNCNTMCSHSAKACRVIAFANYVRKQGHRAMLRIKNASKKDVEIRDGFTGIRKFSTLIIMSLLSGGFLSGMIYFSASMEDGVKCSTVTAVCSLEDVVNPPSPQLMPLYSSFDTKTGCRFDASNVQILQSCSLVMQKALKGDSAVGLDAKVQVSYLGWNDGNRVMSSSFGIPANGLALKTSPIYSGPGRRKLAQQNFQAPNQVGDVVVGSSPSQGSSGGGASSVTGQPPSSWTCQASYYSASDGCDCGCNAVDPDCALAGQQLFGCSGGATGCDGTGQCIYPAATGTQATTGSSAPSSSGPPSAWTCSPGWYNAQDGCDCGCGAYDPDCDIPGMQFFRNGASCEMHHDTCTNPGGTCTTANGDTIPVQDTVVVTVDTTGAETVTTTNNGTTTTDTTVAQPPASTGSWECSPSWYNAMDGCDCGCGIPDPDCAYAGMQFYPNGQYCYANPTFNTCNEFGQCAPPGGAASQPSPAPVSPPPSSPPPSTPPPSSPPPSSPPPSSPPPSSPPPSSPPPSSGGTQPATCAVVADPVAAGWTGPPSYYNANDGCDCNSGICDPDCNGSELPGYIGSLYGCSLPGLAGNFVNFMCLGSTCVPRAAAHAVAAGCPCGNWDANGVCLCPESGSSGGSSGGSGGGGGGGGGNSGPVNSCYSYTSFSYNATVSFSECVGELKSCPAWFEANPVWLPVKAPHIVEQGIDISACQAMKCMDLGDGNCDADLNNAACGYDAGDCCPTTMAGRQAHGPPLSNSDCIDPAGQVNETWISIRTAEISNTLYTHWDHIAKSIMPMSLVFTDYAALSWFNTANATLYSTSVMTMDNVFGWDAPTSLGKVAVANTRQPNAGNYTWLPTITDSPYQDYLIEGIAGQYLSVYVDVTYDALLEVIAPYDNGTAADPLAVKTEMPTHDAAQEWTEYLEGAPGFNETSCKEWFQSTCSCYACYCSCGTLNVTAVETEANYLNHCIPFGTMQGGCGGAHTVHYDVYVDPGVDGVTIDVEMSHASSGHRWPMITEIKEPANGLGNGAQYCQTTAAGIVDCCWPYSGTCPPQFGDMITMAAGAMVQGQKKVMTQLVTTPGYYKVQAKAYGYVGGQYDMKIKLIRGGASIVQPDTADSTGGVIAYGETLFGNITKTGEVHKYNFTAVAGDVVIAHMGPMWMPSSTEDLALCGLPYGKGKKCLDTQLSLFSPNGTLIASNHMNMRDRGLVGSSLNSGYVMGSPWYWETGQGGYLGSYKTTGVLLTEAGTYTLHAAGSAAVKELHAGAMANFSPTGAYYLQLLIMKRGQTMPPECPANPPLAAEEGCANYLWTLFSSEARYSKRNANCERHYPQMSPVGSNTHYGSLSLNDHVLKKTGTYTLRVRPFINNCFEEGYGAARDLFCKPFAGPYDIRAKVRSTPAPASSSSSFSFATEIRPHAITYGTSLYLSYACSSTSYSATVNEVCFSEMRKEKECKSSWQYYDNIDLSDGVEYVADLVFQGTAGDIICADIKWDTTGTYTVPSANSAEKLQLLTSSGEEVTFTDISDALTGSVAQGKTLGFSGIMLSMTDSYTIRVTSSENPTSSSSSRRIISVGTCPDKYVDASTASPDECDFAFSPQYKWDKCMTKDDPYITYDGSNITFSGNEAGIGFGMMGFALDSPTKYYFEMTTDGDPSKHWIDLQGSAGMVLTFGLGTRFISREKTSWLGIDDQAFVKGNSYDKGYKWSNGGGNNYGEAVIPGDVIGVAFDPVSKRMWISKNGYWESPSSCNFDLPTTKWNNFPEPLCNAQYGITCAPKPWNYNPQTDNSAYGYQCCPIPENPGKPRCPYTSTYGAYGSTVAERISCCPGNPVLDGRCSVDGRQHELFFWGSDWAKVKPEPLFGNTKMVFPVVSSNGGTSFDINYGQKPFLYPPPCGFATLVDPTYTTDCWTCQGLCASYDTTFDGVYEAGCTSYVNGTASFQQFLDMGMVEGGTECKLGHACP